MSQTNRFWAIGAVMIMIVTLVAGWFLGAQPLLAASATADGERFAVDAQNASSQAEIAQLAADNEKLPELQREYAVLKQSIPTSADTSPFLNDLDTLAASAGVVVNGFTVAEPQAYTIPLSATAPVVDPAAEETAETGEPAAPVAPTTPVGYTQVTSPLVTPENFVGIQLTIEVHGPYDNVLSYINGLQTGKRLFLVTGITSARDVDSGAANIVTTKVTGQIYVIKAQ